jgi:3-isopropylmalate dehydrogenase
MMLDWLAERHAISQLAEAAGMLDRAIERGFFEERLRPMEFGGDHGLKETTAIVIKLLDEEMVR